jgi:hypothetical protein
MTLSILCTPAYCQRTSRAIKKLPTREELVGELDRLGKDQANLIAKKQARDRDYKNINALRKSIAEAEDNIEPPTVTKYICNAWNVEHDRKSECSNPEQGFREVQRPNPNYDPSAKQRLKDAQDSLVKAQAQYASDKKAYNDEAKKFRAEAKKVQSDIDRAGYGRQPDLLTGDRKAILDYTNRVAEQNWSRKANEAAQKLEADTELNAELEKLATGNKYLKADDLRDVVSIESAADRQTGVNSSGYAGLFQMGPNAAKQVGADYKVIKDPANWKMNADAGVKYLTYSAKGLEDNNISPTAFNVYLAHQQGVPGASTILRAVSDGSAKTKAANVNMLSNLPSSYINTVISRANLVTVQDYYDYWKAAWQAVNE